ncbi:MAG: hypothetical protein SFX18_06395 [Pirellulales bacterium]|nr:hypothetical protein [Pirellulales bacterium]
MHLLLVARSPDSAPVPPATVSPAQANFAGSLALFDCSFEQLSARLNALTRMDCEPDGAFVWVGTDWLGPAGLTTAEPLPAELPVSGSMRETKDSHLSSPEAPAQAWQMEGQLSDREGKICSVEVKGSFPFWAWKKLLECCGYPQVAIRVILLKTGQSLELDEFLLQAREPP